MNNADYCISGGIKHIHVPPEFDDTLRSIQRIALSCDVKSKNELQDDLRKIARICAERL